MTKLKLQTKLNAGAAKALDPHVQALFDNPGGRVMGVVELTHAERLQAAPGADKDDYVAVRVTQLEVARGEQDELIRTIQRALYLQRTARGTLDEVTGDVELSDEAVRLVVGQLHAAEASRLRAGLLHWAAKAKAGGDSLPDRLKTDSAVIAELRSQLRAIGRGLEVIAYANANGDDE